MNNTHHQNNIADLIRHCGDDPEREGLKDTPARFIKAIEFLTSGYERDINKIINGALFESDTDEMVIIQGIEFYSLCEHHLLPFLGHCHIGYIPNGKVLGLSKFAHIVDLFSHRLQIQENLTKQIADSIEQITSAKGVGVIIESKHMCMMMRGIQKQSAFMTTSAMKGDFKQNLNTRQEFLNLINRS